MTVELAQEVLKDVFPQGEAVEISIKGIQDTISDRFGLSLESSAATKRSRRSSIPARSRCTSRAS